MNRIFIVQRLLCDEYILKEKKLTFVYVLAYDFPRSEGSFERHRRVRQMLKYFHNKMDFVDAHLECYETTV